MKTTQKTIILLFLTMLSFISYGQTNVGKYHRMRIIGTSSSSLCNYFNNPVDTGSTKINIIGLTSKLVEGNIYFINNNYVKIITAVDYSNQDANDDWTISYQPQPININSTCKRRYVRATFIGFNKENALNFYCSKNGSYQLDNRRGEKINLIWTGQNLQENRVYKFGGEGYYYIISITNQSSNGDADETYDIGHIDSYVNLNCPKKYHRVLDMGTISQVYNNCRYNRGSLQKVNFVGLNKVLEVNKLYRINGRYYKIIQATHFNNPDADDDIVVNYVYGPQLINIGVCR